jgi:peptidoglycan/xylan/chitin deacetylase (PgdA/CDA1 family)
MGANSGGEVTRIHPVLKHLGRSALQFSLVRRAALAAAAIRHHGLVLVFHRISEPGRPSGGVVPTVPEATFRRQLEVLLELGDIVPVSSLVGEPVGDRRPSFGLTLDDDSITHHDVVLPILLQFKVPATFFLSGRSLHDLPPPWFEILDRLILDRGSSEVGRWLDIRRSEPGEMAEICEMDPRLQRKLEAEAIDRPESLGADHIDAIVNAGMTVGFHTLHHERLTELPDDAIDAAMVDGRPELEAVVGSGVRLFAYPHGKADGRIAGRVERAGYVAAWTGSPEAIRPGSDPYLLGRWEPGPLRPQDFGAKVLTRLHGRAGRSGGTERA